MVTEFDRRRNAICDALGALEGVTCMKPQGAFYVFPNMSAAYGKGADGVTVNSSVDLAGYLLDAAGVAVVPGAPFGDDNCIRLSYATAFDSVIEGVKRIKEALSKLA